MLGPLEAVRDGEPVALGGQRQRALLALLLLRRNEVVATERLVDELWGEHPPKTAVTSLQNAVSALRKLLGPELLETRAPGYVLRVEDGAVDAHRFERSIAAARGAPARERAALLREALALWRGQALAGLEFEAFAQGEIRRLEELRLGALEDRIDAEIELGHHAEVVGELEALVAEHPLRERLRAQLMLALYRSGRQADALAAYQAARRTLVEELGIDPGPALQQLHAAILRQERTLHPLAREDTPDDHFDAVAAALLAGRVVPVLGSDADALARLLAQRFATPGEEGPGLARVAQYVALIDGPGPLYDALHDLVGAAAPTALHRFLAALPSLLRARGAANPLLVTCAHDLALEQALLESGEEFDTVSYLAAGRDRGRFVHLAPDGAVRVVDVPNTYAAEVSLERRPAVLKLHGGADRNGDRDRESYVVTEDDSIAYLAETPLAGAVPVGLAAALRRSHLLFLGFGVREWTLRALLHRVWGGEPLRYRSWAVVPAATPAERLLWRARGVELVEAPLEDYVEALGRRLGLAEEAVA